MLAGNIKQKHFLLVVGGIGAAALTAFLVLRGGGADEDKKPDPEPSGTVTNAANTPRPLTTPTTPGPSTTPPVVEAPPPTTSKEPVPTPPPADNMREVDKLVTARAGKDLGGKKIKDAFKGRSFKVNLYQDAGKAAVSRAKVDLDRDGKWDEKWTFDGTNITRKVAPGDDENYSEKSVWNGKKWVVR